MLFLLSLIAIAAAPVALATPERADQALGTALELEAKQLADFAELVRNGEQIDSLATDELTAVADYLSRLRGPVRDRAKLRDDGTVDD